MLEVDCYFPEKDVLRGSTELELYVGSEGQRNQQKIILDSIWILDDSLITIWDKSQFRSKA